MRDGNRVMAVFRFVVVSLLGLCAMGWSTWPAGAAEPAAAETLLQLRRKRLAEWKKQIVDLRKKATSEASRENALKAKISAKKKELTSRQANAKEIKTEQTAISNRKEETSSTLAAHRQAEAALDVRVARLQAALADAGLALHVGRSPDSAARNSLALYLAARRAEAAQKEQARLAALIRESEQTQQSANGDLSQAERTQRAARSQIDKLTAEIRQLEQQRQTAHSNRLAHLARITQLDKLSRSLEKEIAGHGDAPPKASDPPKPSREKPAKATPPKPKPTPRRPPDPLPATLKDGTGYDLMVAEGTDVYAIGAGRVLFAGRFPGYGNLIILQHPDGVSSLYGFLSEILVSSQQSVSQGQKLGQSGFIEDKDKAGLRFEMRMTRRGREVVIDPKSWLPAGADMMDRLLRGAE